MTDTTKSPATAAKPAAPDEAAKAAAADATLAASEEAAAEAASTEAAAANPNETVEAKPAVPTDIALAAQKRAEAVKGGKLTEAERMIAALEAEKQGYVQRGNAERAGQVDKQIAFWSKKGKA